MAKIPTGWKNSFKQGSYATQAEAKNIASAVRKYSKVKARIHELTPGKWVVLQK